MFYIVWDASLNTGIDSIDIQHRQIVDYINQLHTAIDVNDQAAISDVLDQVVNYTLTHFSFEEQLMERASYPLYDAHRAVHQSFTKRMHDYHRRLSQGEDVGRRLLADLRVWLTNHIKNDDRDYALTVKAQGANDRVWLSSSLP